MTEATTPEDEPVHVWIDQNLCTGDGLCVQYAREVFEFDVDGLAYVKDGSGELQGTLSGTLSGFDRSLRWQSQGARRSAATLGYGV